MANSGGRWRALATTLVVTLALAFATEGVLRLGGIGRADPDRSRLGYQRVPRPLFVDGAYEDGSACLATRDPRLPPQALRARKEPHGLRVLCFGGSATAGLGFSPNVTFARHLERMLVAACPDRAVEVVNLGVTALSSRQVRQMVAEACVELQPDLLVVYSGNNEFLEPHARRFSRARASALARLAQTLSETHVGRTLAAIARREDEVPLTAAEVDAERDALQLTQSEIIAHVSMTPAAVAAVLDEYEANIRRIAQTANAHNVPLVLMGVAANWRWRGRDDLPVDWSEELVPAGTPERILTAVEQRLAAAGRHDRHEWLYRRAVTREALGDLAGAREDFRAAMNEDPHLRRALDEMSARVRRVAAEYPAEFVDTVARFSERAEDGIVGFAEFYDYVHFTPRGAVLAAEAAFEAAARSGAFALHADFAAANYVRDELLVPHEDPTAVDRWRGDCFDPDYLADRDLWKYERMLETLDERLRADPADARALLYRGNARAFRQGGRDGALADWRAAQAAGAPAAVVAANGAWLAAHVPLAAAAPTR